MTVAFNVSRPEFLNALALLQNIAGKKGTMAILANILLEADQDGLTLTATDLEVGLRCRLAAEVFTPGEISLPGRKLFELVREAEAKQIELVEQDNNRVKISAGKSDCRLAGMAAAEFPAFPPHREDNLVELEAAIVRELIDKTIYAVAQEGEGNFNLAGILMEKEMLEDGHFLRLVSSDGHRLAMMESKVEADLSPLPMERVVLVPRKGVQEVRKLCEDGEKISLGLEEKQLVVKAGAYTMVARLMSGDFPDYKSIIQTVDKNKFIGINRESLMHSLRRVNIFTEDRFNAVHFIIENGRVTLSSQNQDFGSAKEEIEAAYEGETMRLGFNGKYFYEGLQVMDSEMVKAYINAENSPCLLQGDSDTGYLSVIMPMKI
ncbi:MAG: DNA polymerase III subunit beta [Desulfurivibrio sp.]|nr:DNA polymerase III subunit beta [Desulfurivibrio sp.]